MSTVAPNTFSNVSVIAATAVIYSSGSQRQQRGQLDLRGKAGAILTVTLAKLSTTAFTNPVDVIVERLFNPQSGSAPNIDGDRSLDRLIFKSLSGSGSTSGTITARLNAASNAGDTSIVIKTNNTGLSSYDSKLAIIGATAPGSLTDGTTISNFEIAEMNATSGAGPWTLSLRGRLRYAHSSNDYVTSNPETFDIPLAGGFVYDVIVDATNISAGTGAIAQALAATYDSDNIA